MNERRISVGCHHKSCFALAGVVALGMTAGVSGAAAEDFIVNRAPDYPVDQVAISVDGLGEKIIEFADDRSTIDVSTLLEDDRRLGRLLLTPIKAGARESGELAVLLRRCGPNLCWSQATVAYVVEPTGGWVSQRVIDKCSSTPQTESENIKQYFYCRAFKHYQPLNPERRATQWALRGWFESAYRLATWRRQGRLMFHYERDGHSEDAVLAAFPPDDDTARIAEARKDYHSGLIKNLDTAAIEKVSVADSLANRGDYEGALIFAIEATDALRRFVGLDRTQIYNGVSLRDIEGRVKRWTKALEHQTAALEQ